MPSVFFLPFLFYPCSLKAVRDYLAPQWPGGSLIGVILEGLLCR